MIDDTFFFNDYTDIDHLGITRNHRTRLVRYTDKKDQFLWWSIDTKEEIDIDKSSAYVLDVLDTLTTLGPALVADSGVYDYTPTGTFFGLTEAQRSRALTKKISKPIPLA